MNIDGSMKKPRLLAEAGFTILEMLVVMLIFMTIIIISSEAFNKIVSVSSQQSRSAESDTQGVIGLEMMRMDLDHAGYGLPWLLDFVDDFDETAVASGSLAPGIDSTQFNDKKIDAVAAAKDSRKTPRAFQAASATSGSYAEIGRDYLVIKSTRIGMNDTVQKWTYVEGVGATSNLKPWGTTDDFAAGERVVTIDSRTKRLINAAAEFSYTITAANMTPPDGFRPSAETDYYVVYGVAKSGSLRVPYNRADYYVKRPAEAKDLPKRCAPGTGILYKAVLNHDDDSFSQYPLMECVADMQVIFSLDTNGDGGVDLHTAEDGLKEMTAKEIRQQLKEVRVYILSHEGGKDTGFQYASPTIDVGEFSAGRTLDLNSLAGADYRNYRWKTYRLVVTPKNVTY